MPTGVRMPVLSMSMRALIGIVQALVTPGNCIAWFISAISCSGLIRSGQICRKGAWRNSGQFGVPAIDRSPLVHRLQHDGGFDHRQRRGIGRGFRPAGLAEHALDLGELAQFLVHRLQKPLGLGHRDARHRGGHVEQRALVQRRHELRAQLHIDRNGRQHQKQRRDQSERLVPQYEIARRLVDAEKPLADGVLFFGIIAADGQRCGDLRKPFGTKRERVHAGEEHPNGRIERDGQDGGNRHRQVLRVGQRLEQSPFLIDQGKDRHESHGDHQERKEDRRADLLQSTQPNFVKIAFSSAQNPFLQPLVGVFDLDDRAVHEHADGDGDSGQRHDVRGQAHEVERDEHEHDGDRNRQNRDDRRGDVPKEDQDDQADDDDFEDQFFFERVDGSFDERGAIVGGDDFDSLRAATV